MKKASQQIKENNKYIFLIIFMLIGGLFVLISSAASNYSISETENSVLSGSSQACNDANSSNGKFVIFGTSKCTFDARKFLNPVKTWSPDPGVFMFENRYYMVYTSGDPTFWIFVSDDLVNWQWTYATVFNGSHPWGKDRFWAPEIHKIGSKFIVYYTAGDSTGKLRIGAATANSITGPYTDIGRPLISETYGVIDSNLFIDDNGRNYLYWKEDEGNTRIYAQEVDSSGVRFVGAKVQVLQKGLAWEGQKGVEAPWVMKKDGYYYMFYSGELYSSDKYAIGIARSTKPIVGIYKKG